MLLVGGACGWIARTGEVKDLQTQAKVSEETARRASQKLSVRTAADIQRAQLDSRYAEFRGLKGESNQSQNEFLDTLSAAELIAVLQGIEDSAGIVGLEYGERSQVEKAVERLYELDPALAKKWLSERSSMKDISHFTIHLAEKIGEEDIDSAFAFIREMQVTAESAFSEESEEAHFVSTSLLENAAKVSEDKFLEGSVFGLRKSSSASGSPIEIPDGFDYERVLTELNRLGKEAGDDYKFTRLPTNLLTEWAASDPQAAYDWLSKEPKVSFNDDLDEFIEGYNQAAPASEVGAFLSDLEQSMSLEEDGYRYREVLSVAISADDPEVTKSFMSALQRSPRRTETLEEITRRLQFSSGGIAASGAVLAAMTPAERMNLFNGEQGSRLRSRDAWHGNFRSQMRALNHTDAEIDAILAPRE